MLKLEFRAIPAKADRYAAAWHGQYRIVGESKWQTAESLYGRIRYQTAEHALAGAAVCAEREGLALLGRD